jgi:hypothetical protein
MENGNEYVTSKTMIGKQKNSNKTGISQHTDLPCLSESYELKAES